MRQLTPTVLIYTDGGASPNPGVGGYGIVLKMDEHYREISGGEPETTNNRMELTAVIVALEALKRPCDVSLYSDSKYVVDAFNQNWLAGWQKRGWKKSNGDTVENLDLWQRLLPQLSRHNIKWHWVKGHAGHPENERCDTLASEAIEQIKAGLA